MLSNMARIFEHFKPQQSTPVDTEPFFAMVGDITPSDETSHFDDFNTTRGELYNHLIAVASHADQVELPSRDQLSELLEPLNTAASSLFTAILSGQGEFDDKFDLVADTYAIDNNERCEMIEHTLQLSATLTYIDQASSHKQLRELIQENYNDVGIDEAVSTIYRRTLRSDVMELMRRVSEREQMRTLIREEQTATRASQRTHELAAVAFGAGFALLARRYFKG